MKKRKTRSIEISDENVCAAMSAHLRALSLINDDEIVVDHWMNNYGGGPFMVEVENEVD